eukprot:3282993-Pyramimonas_sp.AAC.1
MRHFQWSPKDSSPGTTPSCTGSCKHEGVTTTTMTDPKDMPHPFCPSPPSPGLGVRTGKGHVPT